MEQKDAQASSSEPGSSSAVADPARGSNTSGSKAVAANAGQPASSTASSSSRTRGGNNTKTSSNSESSTSLQSIDDVVSAIHGIAVTGGDAASQYKLTVESLLPALQLLDKNGTSAGVPGNMVLQSLLQGGIDPLQALAQQGMSTGNGVGYLSILYA